jgi:hypothetical protein
MVMQISAQGNLQRWWRSIYFTDYLPHWIQAFIPRARVRQMFHGLVAYSEKIRELEQSCTVAQMTKLVKDYDVWMQQYKDIINEGTILSGLSIMTGNPDSVLGLWKIIFAMYYSIDETNRCLLVGIKKIINNLELMGAKVHRAEKGILESSSLLEAQFKI